LIGQVVNYRYELLEKCGDGSFFTVYKARDKVLNRLVAVKIMRPEYAAHRDFAERVIAEAQAVSDLTHPHTAKTYEADRYDETYFIATEYVRGVRLKDKIRRQAPFPAGQVIDLTIAIAEAVADAHSHAIVHGDIRPQNVIVTSDSDVKVTDFGIGMAVNSFPSIQSANILRSVHYTAPEVAEGKAPQVASDIYALGIVLYEMLTGTAPFDGDTAIAVALRHAKEPPPSPRAINPATPKSVEAVVLKALQKRPEDRYRTVQEMLRDLRAARVSLAAEPVRGAEAEETLPSAEPIDVDVEEEERPGLLGSATRLAFLVFALAVLVLAITIAWSIFSKPSTVSTPQLVGLTWSEAEKVAREAGLTLAEVEERYNDDYPEGQIYQMLPETGMQIKKGQTIKIWVSKGPRFIEAPDVVNAPEELARTEILKTGLTVGIVTQEYNDTTPAGSVAKQDPAPGTKLERGKPVKLVISLGKEPEVPEPTSEETTVGTPEEGGVRSFNVNVTVKNGPDPQLVRIVVVDDNGENEVYNDYHHPGDRLRQVVTGIGSRIEIRVYVNNTLYREVK